MHSHLDVDKSPFLSTLAPSSGSDQLLLKWLCTNISRDGGASLVTSLKDQYWQQQQQHDGTGQVLQEDQFKASYSQCSPKRLNQLLIQSSIQKPKLLAFLEFYSPSIFQVNRQKIPHWVILTDPIPSSNPYIIENTNDDNDDEAHTLSSSITTLKNKVLYVLRKRQARLNRRATKQRIMVGNNENDLVHVNMFWLLKQCPWEFHFYLRDADIYRRCIYNSWKKVDKIKDWTENGQNTMEQKKSRSADDEDNDDNNDDAEVERRIVYPVMSHEWQDLVLSYFQKFLINHCQDALNIVERTVALKEYSSLETSVIRNEKFIQTNVNVMDESMENRLWLQKLVLLLVKAVKRHGGTRVSLTLLLYRNTELKDRLGGRDLGLAFDTYPEAFHLPDQGHLEIIRREKSCNIYLQWIPLTIDSQTINATSPLQMTERLFEIQTQSSSKYGSTALAPRMKVDTVGLFSVTNSRWAVAIANILAQCCQRIGWDISTMTCIDMTAAVGGMTLGLAKLKGGKKVMSFAKIIALEIDETRSQLCRENMKNHGISDKLVQILCCDSVAYIPKFPNEPCCIVIDPPWGGEHYKEFKENPPLELGIWKLEDILQKIAESSPIHYRVIGLRLPVTMNVDRFLQDKLRKERNLSFEQLTIRKLKVQLFVVIKLSGKAS